MSRALPNALFVALAACASAAGGAGGAGESAAAGPGVAAVQDSAGLPPAGFGTLRQDDIALQMELEGGVRAQVLPLDEGVIRLLSPDSYRALHEQVQGRSTQLREIARRNGFDRVSVWQVRFYGTEQGEARFSPQEVIIRNAGRDFRPLDLVPLTPGFGEQRLRQRAMQAALYVFDGTLDVNQPDLTVSVEGVPDASWGAPGGALSRLERERSLVRSRAARGAAPSKATSVPPKP